MSNIEIVLTGLSVAFCYVTYINRLKIKPFNCLKCMAGWCSLLIGCAVHGWYGLFFLPVGVFVGAMWNAVIMRWL